MISRETLEAIRLKHGVPALGMTVVVDGKPLGPVVVGVRKLGGREAAQPDDAFHLGSNTKAFTGALIGILMDLGKLGPKTTLGDVLPETPTAWRGTTVETLLAHRSGLKRLEPLGKSLLYLHGFRGSLRQQRLRWLKERLVEPPDGTAGKFEYSNVSYTLLGVMAEAVTGQSWEELVLQRLWKPLGITGGGFGAPPLLWQHAAETKDNDGLQKLVPLDPREGADNPPLMGPAGTIYLPLGEWAKFAAVFAAPERQSLLKPETLTWLTSPLLGGDYNGGWILSSRPWAGGVALNHGGSNTFNFSQVWVMPKRRGALLVATNAGSEAASKAVVATLQALIQELKS